MVHMADVGNRSALMTVDQARAEYDLPICRALLYRAIASGEVPSIRLGRRILIPRHAFEEALGLQPAEPAGR